MKQKNAKYNNKSKSVNNAVSEAVTVNTVKSLPRWVFIPIAIILVVIPLITIIHHFDCGLENYEWFSLDGSIDDFFLYYKSFFLRIVGALILVILALVVPFYDHSFLKEKRNISPVVAMGIFGLITLVSSFLSEHMSDAFLGGVEEFEGCFILLTYVVSFYLAFGYIKTIKVIKFILDAIMIGGFLIGLLGFLQTLGFDWMSTDLAKYLVTAEIRDQIDYDSFQIGSIFTDNTAYATLYNPNYMGSYVTVVLPYTAYLTVFGDKLYRKIFALITSVMLIVSLYSSHSLTGMLSVVFAVAVLVVLIIPLLKKKGRVITLSIVGVLIAGAMVVMVSSGFMDKLFASPEQSKGVQSIDNMKNHKDHIDVFLMDGRKMVVNLNKDALTDPLWGLNSTVDKLITLTDEKGENISYEVDGNGHAKINQDGYPGFEFYTDVVTDVMVEQTEENNYGYVSLLYILDPEAEGTFRFKYTGEKIMHLNDFDRTDNIYYIDKWGFRNNDDFASGRGYIWARTFPLLVRCMLTGYGPDNFVYCYPNFDYVGKGYGAYKNMTTSKPHNMYMQIWVQDGFLVVAAMVFLYVLFMIRVFRLCYGKNRLKLERGTTPFGVVLATATAASGFMFVGIANDSLVGITSIYWCMLGVGYAAESMCHKQQKELIENA